MRHLLTIFTISYFHFQDWYLHYRIYFRYNISIISDLKYHRKSMLYWPTWLTLYTDRINRSLFSLLLQYANFGIGGHSLKLASFAITNLLSCRLVTNSYRLRFDWLLWGWGQHCGYPILGYLGGKQTSRGGHSWGDSVSLGWLPLPFSDERTFTWTGNKGFE